MTLVVVLALIAGLVSFWTGQAHAQTTCTTATTTPNAARDEARLVWTAPTTNTDGTAVSTPLTYRVYRSTGSGSTAFALQCQTTALTTSLLAQPVGVQNYRVTAQGSGSLESAPSNVATKTIAAPTTSPPTNLSLLEQIIAFFKRLFGHFA